MLAKLQKIICYTLIFTLFNTSFQPLYAFSDFDDDVEESEVSSAPPPPTGPDRMTLTNVTSKLTQNLTDEQRKEQYVDFARLSQRKEQYVDFARLSNAVNDNETKRRSYEYIDLSSLRE